eukprot:gene3736-4085_t
MKIYLGVDIGGSHFSVGYINDGGILLDSSSKEWNGSELLPSQAVPLIVQASRELLAVLQSHFSSSDPLTLCAVGIGCPGQSKNNILVAASNLPNFKQVPLAEMVSQALGGVPTLLLNDADAAICAEVWGHPNVYKGVKNVALVTLGTGVGFGLILNNQLYQGSHGLLEGGHMIVSTAPSSRRCGCGQVGCVEAYSSATNTALRLEEYDAKDQTAAKKTEASKSESKRLTGKDVFARYAVNDYNAVTVVEETAEHLATMVINICRIVDPEVIVFGGGLAQAGDALLTAIRRYVSQKTWTVLPTDVKLVTARSEEAGLVGAALAAQKHGALIGFPTLDTQSPSCSSSSLSSTAVALAVGAALTVSSAAVLLLLPPPRQQQSPLKAVIAGTSVILQASVGLGLVYYSFHNSEKK